MHASLVLAVASVAVWANLSKPGQLHPDEIFQFTEPAFFEVHGRGLLAWEWQVGLRSWLAPGAISLVFRALDVFGVEHPQAMRASVGLLVAALHALMIHAVYRVARQRSADRVSASIAMLSVGVLPLVVEFGGRTTSETLSTAALVVAIADLEESSARRARAWRAGVLFAIATACRFGVLAALAGIGVSMLLTRTRALNVRVFAGGALSAVALGMLDRYTWGSYFESLRNYVEFNVLSGAGARTYGEEPADFYVPILIATMPLVFCVALLVRKRARSIVSDPLFVAFVAYLAATVLAQHKEPRFLYPIVLLAAVWGAVELARFSSSLHAWKPLVWCGSLALASYSFFAIELPEPLRVAHEPVFRLMMDAASECEHVAIVSPAFYDTGGQALFGRRARVEFFDRAEYLSPSDAAAFDCVFTPSPERIVAGGRFRPSGSAEVFTYLRRTP